MIEPTTDASGGTGGIGLSETQLRSQNMAFGLVPLPASLEAALSEEICTEVHRAKGLGIG